MQINPSDHKFVIGGTIRNGGQQLKDDVLYIQNALIHIPNKHWFVVESDSTDNTSEVLRELEEIVDNFSYVSLGNLSKRIPERTQRIAHCRNLYLNEFETTSTYAGADFLIAADLDGVNSCITQSAFDSCWQNSNWDVVTANQWNAYYDIFALRHPLWSPNDCWEMQHYLANEKFYDEVDAKFIAVYSRMANIPESNPWIEVDSAFGGLAIYKMPLIKGLRYVGGLTKSGYDICEHIGFHQQIQERGGHIFINPQLINADSSTIDHVKDYFEWQKQN